MTSSQKNAVLLIKSALTGEKYTLPEDFDLRDAIIILQKNGMISAGYVGACNCGVDEQDPIMEKIKDRYCVEFVRSQIQMEMLEQLYRAFEEKGIDYMPVKGAVMKAVYPSHVLRQMSDADILFRESQRDALETLMKELGYEYREESDHEWKWQAPGLFIELHKRLVSSDEKNQYSYFGDGWQWGKKQEGCRWLMNHEDAFIYEFGHFTRHYCKGGIGLRHLVDLWMHLRNAPDMDKAYVRRQMNKLHFGEFYKNVMDAIEGVFCDKPMSEEAQHIVRMVFGGGRIIHREEVAISAISSKEDGSAKKGKLRVALKRVFPAKKHIIWNYPQFKKLPLPVAWVARWFSLLGNPERVQRRVDRMNLVTDESVDAYRKSMAFVGLDIME